METPKQRPNPSSANRYSFLAPPLLAKEQLSPHIIYDSDSQQHTHYPIQSMSARYLKKVLIEQEHQKHIHGLVEQDDHIDEDQLSEPGSPDALTRPLKNPFDLLNDGDEDNVHDSDDDSLQRTKLIAADKTSEGNVDNGGKPMMKNTSKVASSSNNKSKKKKKKKNKEKSVSSTDKLKAPLDTILETFDSDTSTKKQGPKTSKATKGRDHESIAKQCASSILQVDPKYLKAENELRRIFGSKVVKSFENKSQTSTSRQIRGLRRGNFSHKKTILVTPSDHWPRWDGSLSMEFLETKDEQHYFRYVHSSSYAQAQRAFEAAKAIHDLNGVASVLMHHPYHLDSLITMAEYFTVVGELQMSSDATIKCLYALECAWHPMFTPLQGNCQLKFDTETNKPLFTSLFTHMKNMDRRGCHRSALEVCKLLLSLDSDDPMGAMFCIDYFALRAEEYSWLEQFSEDYASDTSIWMFPNFSFSLAISRFYLERESQKGGNTDATKSSAIDLMKQALLLHPSVLKKLVSKTPLKDQVWTKILKHSFFGLDETGIQSLDHLINMYVERSYIIWRLPDLQKLLRDAALLVVEILEQDRSEVKDWACVREEVFSSKKNEYGHLLVTDFSDSVPRPLPPDNLQDFVVDPRMGEMGDQAANPNAGGNAPYDIADRNALAALFESMLPWVNYGGLGDGSDEDDEPNGHG